ncbi:MAG TPA: PAS domain S-box protein, partial [Candidatus Aminicenantes bacterium]|nr:PAS domain S-box protein [Candidatus Aminicenantes bacterium]
LRQKLVDLFETGRMQICQQQLTIQEEVRFFECRLAPSGDEGALAIIRDVTTSRAALEALKQSEDRYRQLLGAITDYIYTVEVKNGAAVNTVHGPGAEGVTGFTVADFAADPYLWFRMVHPDDREWVTRQANDWLAGKGQPAIEHRIVRKDGEIRWVRNTPVLRFAPDGTLIAYDGLVVDITETKKAEDNLKTETERLSVTLGAITEGVITTDTEGRVLLFNPVAEQLTGCTVPEVIGRPLAEVLTLLGDEGGAAPIRLEPVREVLRTEAPVEWRLPLKLAAQGKRTLDITASGAPIRDAGGKVAGVVLVFRDITERKKVEAELMKNLKLKSLGILAGGIAHDFNNALTAILGNLSLARMTQNDRSRSLDHLLEAEHATMRAKALTQHLLTFAKGGAPLKRVMAVSDFLITTVQFAMSGSAVRPRFEIAHDLWSAEIDEAQICQVINNIVINADQAMPSGGTLTVNAENAQLEVGGDRSAAEISLAPGPYLRIMFRDEGVGIPREELVKVFDPYYTTKENGMGLGLSIAHSIVERHGGSMGVESELGKGTQVILTLPALGRRVDMPPPRLLDIVRSEGRLLLMDDEEIIRSVGRKMLMNLGYEVEVVAEGGEAVDLYGKALKTPKPFDAVILDLTVPGGMGGVETLKQLRKADPQVKAIVSSGYSSDPVMAEPERYGFAGVIAKPYRIEDLGKLLLSVIASKA